MTHKAHSFCCILCDFFFWHCFRSSEANPVSSCAYMCPCACCPFVLVYAHGMQSVQLTTGHWSWDPKASFCVIMWLKLIVRMQTDQTLQIKGSLNTHTRRHTLCPLHYPPYSSSLSPPPLSPAFQQGNSMLSNFCQMSNTSLPSSAALFPLFLTPIGWAETMNPLPPPRSTYCSQQPNMNPRTQAGEAAALPKQKGMPKQINFPHCMMQC